MKKIALIPVALLLCLGTLAVAQTPGGMDLNPGQKQIADPGRPNLQVFQLTPSEIANNRQVMQDVGHPPASKAPPMTVKSGAVQATIKGKVVTYTKGQTIPEGAELTATSDAVIGSGGTTIKVPSGASFQAARFDDGRLDVRSDGGTLTITQNGSSATIPAGTEVGAGNGKIDGIEGTATVTTGGHTTSVGAGQELRAGAGSETALHTNSILTPPPPSPELNNHIVPVVSPSTP